MQARLETGSAENRYGRPPERSRYAPARSLCIRIKRQLRADSARVYEALLDPRAWQTWIAPEGALCRLHRFDPCQGGRLRYSLLYPAAAGPLPGGPRVETYRGCFSALVPWRKVVLLLEREAADPDSFGEMGLAFLLEETGQGTDLLLVHDRIPPGLAGQDHERAWRSALANLAAWTETDDP